MNPKLTEMADNAYVSGLKEDLGFHGNELVQLQTMYTIGAVLGQLPFAYLFTKLPMSWIIPFMDVAWVFSRWSNIVLLHSPNWRRIALWLDGLR